MFATKADGLTIGLIAAAAIGGLGCTGSGGAVCGPRASNGQLGTDATAGLVVAPDENHVAFVREARTWESGCPARASRHTAGTLVALTLRPDGDACERVVAHDVEIGSVFFSGDSRGMVFTDGVDDCGVGVLETAAADGGNVRRVRDAVYEHDVVGTTVFFTSSDEPDALAVPIDRHAKPFPVGVRSDIGWAVAEANPTGTALAFKSYEDGVYSPDDSLVLVQLPSGELRTVSDGITESAGGRVWSSSGEWLAFLHGPPRGTNTSLALVRADGTARTEVSANCGGQLLAFAPDDSWLAYDEPDGSGGSRLMTYSLRDGRNVALGVLPAGYPVVSFSDDGVDVTVTVDPLPTINDLIYGASAGVADSLQLLTDAVSFPQRVTAGGRHAAVAVTPATVEVYPVAGGAPVVLAGQNPQFETGVPDPRLLVWQPYQIGVAATDGTAAAFQTVPDEITFASWFGSAAVYGTRFGDPDGPDDPPTSVTALTASGASAALARGAGDHGWAPIAAPTRLFYSRAAANAGGPTGLWVVDVPR